MDSIDVAGKVDKAGEAAGYGQSVEKIESTFATVNSRLEAEAILRKSGVSTQSKTPGDLMLAAAQHGYMHIVKFYECGMYPLTYQNTFGDSLLHSAAKGSQAQTCYYLMKRGLRPTIQNKFCETPLFAAAEAGSLEVVTLLCQQKDNEINH